MKRLRYALAVPLLMAGGCDDTDFHGHEPGETTDDCDAVGDYCGTQSVFEASCLSCHSAGAAVAGLDLETDPWLALVDAPSANTPDATLVVPGDPVDSLLYRKVSDTQGEDEGDVMPPHSAGLGQGDLDLLHAWIEGGATDQCEGEPDTGDSGQAR